MDTTTGARRALLIGVNHYPYLPPDKQLHGCLNDIVQVRQFLVAQAGFPPAQVQTLLSPNPGETIPPGIGPVGHPTAQEVRAAFAALGAATQPGDEVVIYYSGHGVRFGNPANENESVYGLAALDTQLEPGAFGNVVLNHELNAYIHPLAAQATVTMIIDSCHSGGATRDLEPDTARELDIPLSSDTWAAFLALQGEGPAPALVATTPAVPSAPVLVAGVVPPPPAPAAPPAPPVTSGWVPRIGQDESLIVLSGCRDSEKSYEYPRSTPTNGTMTYFLLNTLQQVDKERIPSLLWQDLYPRLRQAVQTARPEQTPTLEGRSERPLFGGQWTPYEPGFTVTIDAAGVTTLDGGVLQGLDVGAEVDIYPPGTASFAEAIERQVQTLRAAILSATAVSSTARPIHFPNARVPNGARARLVKPSTRTPALGVQLTAVPAAVATAAGAVPEAAAFLAFGPANGALNVEVRPWPATPNRWAIVPYAGATRPLTGDDVIAYLPGLSLPAAEPSGDYAARLGAALGQGLVHWARYWAVLTRRNEDTTLQGAFSVTLLGGSDFYRLRAQPSDPGVAPPLAANAAGEYVVDDRTYLLLRIRVPPTTPRRLAFGVLLCSHDGNIQLLWPPPNAPNVVGPGEERFAGVEGPNPLLLATDRSDQQSSLFTFKVFAIAADSQEAINLASLEQAWTVQQVIDDVLAPSRAGEAAPPATPPPILWTTQELPVRIRWTALPPRPA